MPSDGPTWYSMIFRMKRGKNKFDINIDWLNIQIR